MSGLEIVLKIARYTLLLRKKLHEKTTAIRLCAT